MVSMVQNNVCLLYLSDDCDMQSIERISDCLRVRQAYHMHGVLLTTSCSQAIRILFSVVDNII